MITTIEELWAYVLKDLEPKSKEYYKAEYYMGQLIATYGAQKLIDDHNKRQIGV
jgi:hypothetical protein